MKTRFMIMALLSLCLPWHAGAQVTTYGGSGLPPCSTTGYVPTYSSVTGQYTCQSVSGTAANPGGSANQIQWNSAGTAFGGFTMSGDCTIVVSTGVITCTKSGGTLLTTLFQAAGSYVSQSTTVNGHALSGNVTVTPTDLSLVIGTNTEAWSANLDSWSAIAPSAKAASNASTTVNGQTCTLGSTCTVADSTKVATVSNVSAYMGGGEQAVTVSSNAATCNWASGSTCVLTAQNSTTAWTLTMSNPVAGQVYRIYVIQGASGPAPLPTFSPTVTWVNGAPTFSGASTKHDAITCQYSGAMSAYFCGSVGDNF